MRRVAHQVVEALLNGGPTPPYVVPQLPDLVQDTPLDRRWAVQDVALDFMEGEIGRHDWRRNWTDYKALHGDGLRGRVSEWLKHFEIDHDPQGLIDYIDGELTLRDGKWL